MTRPITKPQMDNLWLKNFSRTQHCCLCGNSGIIDTRGKVFTAAGHECGDLVFCICPNGQTIQRKTKMDFPTEAMALRRR